MRVVVLGMHKSGTTLVAQALHRSGIWMGAFREDLDYGAGNKYEHHAFQAINRQILARFLTPAFSHRLRRGRLPETDAAGYPLNQDSQAWIRWRDLQRSLPSCPVPDEAVRLVETLDQERADWGFKDPRTALTYPVWSRILPPHRIVVVFRGLGQVLQRYRAGPRHPLRTLRVIHAWTVHNWAILRHLESAGSPALVLRYERLMTDPEALEPLSAFVGRTVYDAREPGRHRSRTASSALPTWTAPYLGRLPVHPKVVEESMAALETPPVVERIPEPSLAVRAT